MGNDSELLAAVLEIRELLRLMAEPAIADRDKKRRGDLRRIAANSRPRQKAIGLMDGTRTQTEIHKEAGIHKGQLSELVKALNGANLLAGEVRQPKIAITIPTNFFEGGSADE